MAEPIDALLFDIDGTICEYRRGPDELLSLVFERAGVEPFFSTAEYVARFEDFLDESDDMQSLRERIFAAIARESGRDPELGRRVARAYAEERDHSNVRFCEGAREALETLGCEYHLGAVTNGAPGMQSTKLDSLGVDCFETVVHAGYDAPAKPDPEPFEVALDRLETRPERAVYVGNSLDADVQGAQAAGMRAAWLPDGQPDEPTPTPDFVLDSVADLLDEPWTISGSTP